VNNFFIEIKPTSLDELTTLYNSNPALRSAITKAQHKLEKKLERDPEKAGIYLSGGVYRIDEWPLSELYTITPILSEVEIFSISLLE
jgi:hypothetical protein